MGKPLCVNPHGTEIAGSPHTLNGRVLRSSLSSAGRNASGFALEFRNRRSRHRSCRSYEHIHSANIARMLRRASSNSRRCSIYSAAETSSPLRIRRSVSGWYNSGFLRH